METMRISKLGKWLGVAALVGAVAGSASAAFLWALKFVTDWREAHVWVIALLPFAAFAIGWIYHSFGKSIEAGHDLIVDEIHDPNKSIPLRMAPLILFSTVVTHLFGGSVGREGTAIQMGGSLADQLTKPLGLGSGDRRILLMAGISAGFGSVFGTPLAGAIFGLEVLAVGSLRYEAIFPCFAASIIGDRVTRAWGIRHEPYALVSIPEIHATGLFVAICAGMVFGLTALAFKESTHRLQKQLKKKVSYAPLRSLLGGVVVAVGVWALGTTKYVGLGIPTISNSFTSVLPASDFFGKFVFTVVSLGTGMKGGEVTPLFFIGATLGNALGRVLPLSGSLLAAMGFVGVFAGAANTPLATTVMAMEIFGSGVGVYAAIACVVSYLFSGYSGIYRSQRIVVKAL
jgi:H+/Cl- antiporter ClcA